MTPQHEPAVPRFDIAYFKASNDADAAASKQSFTENALVDDENHGDAAHVSLRSQSVRRRGVP